MDRHNRWQRLANPALLAVLTALLCSHAASAQQQPRSSASRPFATTTSPALRPAQTESVDPTTLRGTSRADDDIAPRDTRLTDFDRSVVTNDIDDSSASPDDDTDPLRRNSALDPDIRNQADRDAFDNPPAGHDPRYFQIEVEPLNDRRTRSLFEQAFFATDPFAHLGWRLGSFIFFQEFEIGPAWDSNVFLEQDPRQDWLADFQSESRLVSDWANHALELRMLHNRTFHRKFTNENNADQTYELRGRLDVTSRTNLEALASRAITQESRNSIDAAGSTSQQRADVTTDRVTLALNHRFNRLSLQLRGGHADTQYETTATTNNNRDLKAQTLALRAQWEIRPTFSIFGEVERDVRRHPDVTNTDGLSRNSDGERYRTGVALGQTGEFLRGEASIGYGIQRPEAGALPDIEAFLVDANVAWRISPLTSVLFDARTTFGETTLAGSPGVLGRRAGVSVRHAFGHRLIGETGVSYSTQDYPGATLSEHEITFNANVEYNLSRHAALFSRYQHNRFRSNEPGRDYNASTVMLGARLRN